MISFQLVVGSDDFAVEAAVVLCGVDVCVAIGGGTRHHVGASAVSLPRPSLREGQKTSASTSVFCLLGHKEDELARRTAERIAVVCRSVSCVTVGLHVDNASRHDIEILVANYERLVDEILSRLTDLGMAGAQGESTTYSV